MSRFTIIKNEWIPDGIECDHPLCDPLHKRWHDAKGECEKPLYARPRIEWVVWDTTRNERAFNGESFDRRKDAVAYLQRMLEKTVA